MDFALEGRLCVVTGGSRGIGAVTASTLAREGARVLTVARSGADLELDVTDPARSRGVRRPPVGTRERRGQEPRPAA
jgi:NAD(P)-dependent dehydrogenase (short-subunit alcohol dehydrogenase family)